MKKVCFISINEITPWGGSEELWYQTALVLHQKGYSVSVIVIDWKHRQPAQMVNILSLGIKVVTIPYFRTMNVRFWTLLKRYLGDYEQNIIKSAIEKIKPDLVVHTTLAPRGETILADVTRHNIPYVLDIQLADDFLWHAYSSSTADFYNNAKAVYFLSDKNKNATEKQIGLRLLNARRHYNPIKSSLVSKMQVNNVVKFACVGRMGIEHKRQDLLLEILASGMWRSRQWELYFYGSGEHLDSLKNLTKMYDLENRVFFEGHVSDIDVAWEKCHALLLPSTYEGMSLAVTECMEAGRVAIVTNTGGSGDFITDGQHGFIAEAATYNLFNAAMERAWEQKSNWPVIGLKAREHIKTIVPKNAAIYFSNEIISHL